MKKRIPPKPEGEEKNRVTQLNESRNIRSAFINAIKFSILARKNKI